MRIKTIATLLFVALTVSGFAQFPMQGAKDKDFQELFNSKLYVPESGDAAMDKATESALKEYWKISEFEMIPQSGLAEMIQDESKFFLVPVEVKVETTGQAIRKNTTNYYLVLTRGGYKSIDKVKMQNWVFAFPMDIYGREIEVSDMAYRMGPNIKMMNNAIQTIKSKDENVSAGKSAAKFMEELYAGKSTALKDKKLLVFESHVQPEGWKPEKFVLTPEEVIYRASATEKEIDEDYPYEFQVVDEGTIEEAIASHQSGTAVLIPVAFSNFIYLVIDTETYDCLYYGFQVSGLSTKSKSFANIVE